MWYGKLISPRYGRSLAIAIGLISPFSLCAQDTVVDSALRWILRPTPATVRYDYVMAARVRPLLFWVSVDDVGGGYIRRSTSVADSKDRMIEVLFGSDPAKAPRHINHWGAATEVYDDVSSSLLGFMKSGMSGSSSDAEAEIVRQRDKKEHPFAALLSIVQSDRAFARKTLLISDSDLDFHQLIKARELAIHQIQGQTNLRELDGPALKCAHGEGFLQTVDHLIETALKGASTPSSRCYVYNAKNYTLTLSRITRVPSKKIQFKRRNGPIVEKTFMKLMDLEFMVRNQASGEQTYFETFIGTAGDFVGVPVQIVHQPNWWFQVVLNLDSVKR